MGRMANATTSPATQGGLTPAATTPRGSGSVDDNRCKGVRGDNPYRRKWNPRLAAAHRREIEKQKQEEQSQVDVASSRPTLGSYLNAEADAAEEVLAAAAQAEAAEAEAQASALAEIAAAANLADQRLAR